jgi:hypothetical protein
VVRTPLALHLSPAMHTAVVRRAVAAGVDPDGPDFAAWVGDLLLRGLPAAVADVLRVDDESLDDDSPGPESGAVCAHAPTFTPMAIVASAVTPRSRGGSAG